MWDFGVPYQPTVYHLPKSYIPFILYFVAQKIEHEALCTTGSTNKLHPALFYLLFCGPCQVAQDILELTL